MRYVRLLIVGVGLAAVGCAEAPAEDTDPAINTSPNGTVHTNYPEGYEVQTWQVTEDLRIGRVEGGGPDVFGDIRGVLADSSGDIYVLDAHGDQIHVFDAGGAYIRTIGGAGAGPRELKRPNGMAWTPSQTIMISDVGNHRYVELAPDGSPVGTYRRIGFEFGYIWRGSIDAAGGIVDVQGHNYARPNGRPPPGVEWNTGTQYVKRVQPGGSLIDSTAVPITGNAFYRVPFGSTAGIPFLGREFFATAPDGTIWIGESDAYRLTQIDDNGDTLAVVERSVAPIAVSAMERRIAVRRLSERTPGFRFDLSLIPEFKPPILSMFVDVDARLWVRRSRSDSVVAFDIYSASGELLAEAALDFVIGSQGAIATRGPYLYGIVRDDLDVQYVVRGRIEPVVRR